MQSSAKWQPYEGMDVIAADGDKVGKIVAVRNFYMVVEKGFFFPKDYYIPRTAISNMDEDNVYLNVTRDAALTSGWDVEPADLATETTIGQTGVSTAGAGGTAIPTNGGEAWLGETRTSAGYVAEGYDPTATTADTLRVPVHEEELTATKRPVDYGAVEVDKDVVVEERTLDVPVTEERVRVTRRTVDRDAATGDKIFEEGTVEVPVRGEEVDVQKRTRVAEEVEIAKEAVQRTERVSDTVRREVVNVRDKTTGQRRQVTRDELAADPNLMVDTSAGDTSASSS